MAIEAPHQDVGFENLRVSSLHLNRRKLPDILVWFTYRQYLQSVSLAFALALIVATCQAETITGKVVGVHDGDTITVLDASRTEHKVRLNGVDEPELGQPFGQASKRHLSDLVFGKTVNVETNKTDRYGRSVGLITLDGKDVNLEQLRAGLAWFYRQYANEVDATRPRATPKRKTKPGRPGAVCGLILRPWRRGNIATRTQPRRRRRPVGRLSAIVIHRFITDRTARTMPR